MKSWQNYDRKELEKNEIFRPYGSRRRCTQTMVEVFQLAAIFM
jgi:hypothetical protein